MEKESFEDEEVAEILNKYYISIKVDREERPDIDHIYMEVCQLLTGSGGWPLTIIMTPNKKPFFAGTYFPKYSRFGHRGFVEILIWISNAWKNQRDKLLNSAESIISSLSYEEDYEEMTEDIIKAAYNSLKNSFDEKYGGSGSAPKFPMPHNIMFLLRYNKMYKERKALNMAIKTLECIFRGGIYDHIGFGFYRYSTDEKWLVPHFEKMLYDNALLMYAYTEAYQIIKKEWLKNTALQIGEYIRRDMTSPQGAFYTAEDADSEGSEGKFYIWEKKEIYDVLGKIDGEFFCKCYAITDKGNFNGKNIPNLIENNDFDKIYKDEKVRTIRNKLYNHREKRVRPFKDDKILTSWNGLMIGAMAFAGRIYGKREFIDSAAKAANFILKYLRRKDGRLLARYRNGSSDYLAYLDDYSFLIWGLIELYQSEFNERYINAAIEIADDMIKLFYDNENKGFFLYGIDGEKLIIRPKKLYDGAVPSGNSVAAFVLIKLYLLTGKREYENIANDMFRCYGSKVKKYPEGYTFFLSAYMLAVKQTMKIVFVGEKEEKGIMDMLEIINNKFLPNTIISIKNDGESNYKKLYGKNTVYICRGNSCIEPINDLEEFSKIILKH